MMCLRMLFLLAIAWLSFGVAEPRADQPPDAFPAPSGQVEEGPTTPGVDGGVPPQLTRQALYRVGPGDILIVQVYGEKDLTGPYPVSSSGELDFPLLGVLSVDKLTTAEISAQIAERLGRGYLHKPHVTVSVDTYASQPVQVMGAVGKPGLYFLQGPTTVLQMLSQAGGIAADGVDEVRISRRGQDRPLVVPFEELLSEGGVAMMLEAGDVVFVAQGIISVLGMVGKPGEITFRDGLTLSSALAAVGGAKTTANLRKVYVLRGDDRLLVNVKKILDGKDPDFALLPGDRVFVPEGMF
jgi:polysaccharide export outer membrane protein